jgi:rare lipoprotein A
MAVPRRQTCASPRPLNLRGRHGCARPTYALSKALLVGAALALGGRGLARAEAAVTNGVASWYGEEHRGKLMANGKRFNPDKFTAASWFYPLGTKVRVTVASPSPRQRSVEVTITDRGPDKDLVRDGRIIDLSHAPFKQLAPPYLGLIAVAVQPLQ